MTAPINNKIIFLKGLIEGKLTVKRKENEGVICPTTVTTLHYLGKKILGEKKARALIQDILGICEIGEISKISFNGALESKVNDFEDAVIESVAILMDVDFIATRNLKDFRGSRVEAQEPPFFI